jgi:hypothetical protein
LKTHQILHRSGFFPQRLVTDQTGAVYRSNLSVNRQKPVAQGVWFGNLNLSGFFDNRSNRSDKPFSGRRRDISTSFSFFSTVWK